MGLVAEKRRGFLALYRINIYLHFLNTFNEKCGEIVVFYFIKFKSETPPYECIDIQGRPWTIGSIAACGVGVPLIV